MLKLTLDGFYKIWETVNLTGREYPKYVLYYNATFKGGNLRYYENEKSKPIYIAEGDFNLISCENEAYSLTIGNKIYRIKLYVVYDDCSEFTINITEFESIVFRSIYR